MENLLTQGISLPRLGLGTFRMQGDACRAAVESALALGYRHIDTAEMYGNESAVGAAIASSGIPREQLHITTKVWHDHLQPAAIREAFARSLDKLELGYVDLYLVHWPSPSMDLAAVFQTLGEIKADGGTRAIGACNFNVALLKAAVEQLQVPLACNQVEYHVLLDQGAVHAFLRAHGIPLVAYCPLAQGRLADQATLQSIARKHDATATQVALKWLLDQDLVAAIPKAQREESQRSNVDALKLVLDDDDRRMIAELPTDQRLVNPGFAPKWD